MSVSRYFGLPGCGKTTTLAMLAYKGVRSGRYEHIYSNVHLEMPGVTYIPFSALGQWELRDCLILIDEAMVYCGDRDYKSFDKSRLEFFVMHRHHYCDIVLFSQEADGVDKKIRSISADMYYVKKGLLLGNWITTIYKIPYGIVWPDRQSNGENLGKIVMGYIKPSLISRLCATRYLRSKYYPYFDSWECDQYPPLPAQYQPVPGRIENARWFSSWLHKTFILLRSIRKNRRLWKRSIKSPEASAPSVRSRLALPFLFVKSK